MGEYLRQMPTDLAEARAKAIGMVRDESVAERPGACCQLALLWVQLVAAVNLGKGEAGGRMRQEMALTMLDPDMFV